MYTIAIVNEKGGTGKTTTAVNLSAAVGQLGHSVLLVDLDGQAASSRWLGVEEDTSFAEALYTGHGLAPLPDIMTNVSLAPASGKLDAVAHDLRPTQGGQLRKLLAEVSDRFEFVIIDCPPSLGNRLIGNALIASTHAIVPVETSILALDGLKILLTTLDDVRDGFGHDIVLAGILACRFDSRTRLSRQILAELKRAMPGRVFDTVIRENVRMRECPASGQSILSYAPDSHAAEDYMSLGRELLASPWLSCRPQDQPDAGGTAAFFAADKEQRIGDALRVSVRRTGKEAAAIDDVDNAAMRKRIEEAKERLAAEVGADSLPENANLLIGNDGAANEATDAASQDAPAGPVPIDSQQSQGAGMETSGDGHPLGKPIEVAEPLPAEEGPVAVNVVPDAEAGLTPEESPAPAGESPASSERTAAEPGIWIDSAAGQSPAVSVGGEAIASQGGATASPQEVEAPSPLAAPSNGWGETKVEPEPASPVAPVAGGWDKPVEVAAPEPAESVSFGGKEVVPEQRPPQAVETWLDLITGAAQPDAPPIRPARSAPAPVSKAPSACNCTACATSPPRTTTRP